MLLNGKLMVNKHPSDVVNGNWIHAKNIVLSEDNIIQTEPSWDYSKYNDIISQMVNEQFEIVHIQQCGSEEACIFIHPKGKDVVYIYRFSDIIKQNNSKIETSYHGGQIVGDYQFINDKLVLTFAEYDCLDGKQQPVKLIDFDNRVNNNVCQYLNPIVKLPKVDYVFEKGRALKGWYFVFIRYKIKHNNYTQWFNINTAFLLDSYSENKLINLYHGDNFTETTAYAKINKSNETDYADISFKLNITNIDDNYNDYQLGYIVVNKTTTKYFRTNDIDKHNTANIHFIGKDLIEYDKEMIVDYDNYFNCHALNFYKNKTYIANFHEIEPLNITDINNCTLSIKTKLSKISVDIDEAIDSTSEVEYVYFDGQNRYHIELYKEGSFKYYDVYDKTKDSTNIIIKYTSQYCKVISFNKGYFKYTNLLNNQSVETWDITNIRYNITQKTYQIKRTDNNEWRTVGDLTLWFNTNSSDASCKVDFLDHSFIQETHPTLISYPLQNHVIPYHVESGIVSETNTYKNDNNILTINSIGVKEGIPYKLFIHFVDKFGHSSDGYDITDFNLTNSNTIDIKNKFIIPYKNNANKTKNIIDLITDDDSIYKLTLTVDVNIDYIKRISNNKYIGYYVSYERPESNIVFTGVNILESNISSQNPYKDNIKIFNIEIDYKERLSLDYDYIYFYKTNNTKNNNILDRNYNIDNIEKTPVILNKQYVKANKINVAHTADEPNNATNLCISVIAESDFTLNKDDTYYVIAVKEFRYIDNKNKILYPCSNITYNNTIECNTNNDFKSTDYAIWYNKDMIYNDATIKWHNKNGPIKRNESGDVVRVYTKSIHKEIPTEFLEYKNAPSVIVFPTNDEIDKLEDIKKKGLFIGSYVHPMNTIDLFEEKHFTYLDACPKVLQNYIKENNITYFSKTIRRSKIIQDETQEINNRFFPLDDYKNIIENKGNIIKITAIGNIILIHTTESLFMFDGNDVLKTDKYNVQLNANDIWDTNYKEILTSEDATAGIIKKEHAIVGEFGYIFYDKLHNHIYRLDGNRIKKIDEDIYKLINKLNDYDLVIFNDWHYNRLLLTFTKDDNKVTISYNYKYDKWVSFHDYTFEHTFKYKDYSYIIHNSKIYSDTGNNIPKYNKYTIGENDISKSVISILFNNEYEFMKFIEYIDYKCYKLVVDADITSSPVERKKMIYGCDLVRVQSEYCDTDYIEVPKGEIKDINILNEYNKPYYRMGNWHWNYLRNINGDTADDKSRIYGNWFVVTLVIDRNDLVELESMNLKLIKDIV